MTKENYEVNSAELAEKRGCRFWPFSRRRVVGEDPFETHPTSARDHGVYVSEQPDRPGRPHRGKTAEKAFEDVKGRMDLENKVSIPTPPTKRK